MKAPIKLVVVNENTLGYIEPQSPTLLSVFRAYNTTSPSSRFNEHSGSQLLWDTDVVRLASQKDFDYFRVSMEGYRRDGKYKTEGYEYAIDPIMIGIPSIQEVMILERELPKLPEHSIGGYIMPEVYPSKLSSEDKARVETRESFYKDQLNKSWKPVTENDPRLGIEVIGFNKNWIDDDLNLNGTMKCFRGHKSWFTCAWHGIETCDPTHFMEIPSTKHLID